MQQGTGTNDLFGGLLQGFVGTKVKAQEQAGLENYRKAMTEHVKTQAKLDEQKINLAMIKQQMEGPINEIIAKAAQAELNGGQPQMPAAPMAAPQPMAQGQAAPPQMPLPDMIAAGQNPLPTGSINIPGNPANNISVRQNNPGNLKFVGQPDALGAGTKGFAIFPTPEAGYKALMNQIEIDKGRNLTLSQFANKYAPPFENDTNNWIKVVGNYTGANPDTPITAIPTPLLAQGIAKIESGTSVGSGMPQPQQAQAPQLNQFAQQPQAQPQQAPMITGRKLLQGYLKKNYGMEQEKTDYRIAKNGDILALQDGKIVNRIPGGENAEWKEIPTGGYALLDKSSKQVLQVIQMPKPYQVAGKTAEGDVTHGFIYPTGTPGAGAGGISAPVVTEPAPNKLPGTIPEGVRTKIGANNTLIDNLNILEQTYRPEYLGAKGAIGNMADSVSGYVSVPGFPADPARQTFTTIYNEMLGQKLHERGGSALTKQEIMYIKNTLPRLSHNPELFKAGIQGAKLLIQASNYELMAAHLTPDKAKQEKAANELIQQYKTQIKPLMEAGLKSASKAPPGAAGAVAPGLTGAIKAPMTAEEYLKKKGLR